MSFKKANKAMSFEDILNVNFEKLKLVENVVDGLTEIGEILLKNAI